MKVISPPAPRIDPTEFARRYPGALELAEYLDQSHAALETVIEGLRGIVLTFDENAQESAARDRLKRIGNSARAALELWERMTRPPGGQP